MWMTSHGQCLRGGACECPRGGCFPIFRRADDVTRTMSKGGGGWGRAPGVPLLTSTHPSSDPPPQLAGWLATGLYWSRYLLVGLVYWFNASATASEPGSYQGREMMMKSVSWWRKPGHPEETTDLRHLDTYYLHFVPGIDLLSCLKKL